MLGELGANESRACLILFEHLVTCSQARPESANPVTRGKDCCRVDMREKCDEAPEVEKEAAVWNSSSSSLTSAFNPKHSFTQSPRSLMECGLKVDRYNQDGF